MSKSKYLKRLETPQSAGSRKETRVVASVKQSARISFVNRNQRLTPRSRWPQHIRPKGEDSHETPISGAHGRGDCRFVARRRCQGHGQGRRRTTGRGTG